MYASTKKHQRSYGDEFSDGKKLCISVPGHELDLIDDLDHLAHLQCINRSQWIRRKIREEKLKLQDQDFDWTSMFGVK